MSELLLLIKLFAIIEVLLLELHGKRLDRVDRGSVVILLKGDRIISTSTVELSLNMIEESFLSDLRSGCVPAIVLKLTASQITV